MTDFRAKLDHLRMRLAQAVELQHSYPHRPLSEGTPASVLLLLSVGDTAIGDVDSVEFLVTRRTHQVETHKGQYALPGGMRDPEDDDSITTALRENEEEMGISRDRIEPIGELPSLWTPTGFLVTPVVALLREARGRIVVKPNEAEIDLWFWCELGKLMGPGIYRQEEKELLIGGKPIVAPIDVFEVDQHRIWGVTGAILRNFIERWKLSGGETSANLTST